MSVHVTAWVYDHAPQDLSAAQMLLALALADYASSETGLAYPSVPALARKTRLTDRAVSLNLKALVDAGVIAVHREATNRLPTVYVFPHFRGERISPQESRGEQNAPQGGTDFTSRGERNSPKPLIEPSREPSTESVGGSPRRTHPYTHEFETFWKRYPRTNGPKDVAFKAWQALKPEQREAASAGLDAWLASEHWRNGYVRHCDYWLKHAMWTEPPVSKPTNGHAPALDADYLSQLERRMEELQHGR